MKALFSTLCVFLLSLSSFSQTATGSLTNKDVMEMARVGLSDEVIKAKVLASEAAFDTSPAALKELQSAGVSQEVIVLVIKHPFGMKSVQVPATTVHPVSREPEYGTIQDIKALSRVFVRADDDDVRATIVRMLKGYERLRVVNSSAEAEILLDYVVLTRDVAANRGPYARGASMALKSQMRAYAMKPSGSSVIAWTETETLNVTNAFTFSAPNEMNLTHHFVRDLQKARGEKTYSMRRLLNRPKEPKPSELKKLDPPFGEYEKKPPAPSPSPSP